MGGPQHKGALYSQRNLSRAQSELQPEHPAKPPPSSHAIIPEICAFCSKGALGSMHVPRSRLKCRRCHVTQGGLAATVCFSETAHGTAGPNCSAPLVDADEGDKCLLPGKALPDASTDAVPKRHPCLNSHTKLCTTSGTRRGNQCVPGHHFGNGASCLQRGRQDVCPDSSMKRCAGYFRGATPQVAREALWASLTFFWASVASSGAPATHRSGTYSSGLPQTCGSLWMAHTATCHISSGLTIHLACTWCALLFLEAHALEEGACTGHV